MARDDLGAGPLILNTALDYGLGAPEIVVAHGRGFGYRIPHRVLDEDKKNHSKFYYNLLASNPSNGKNSLQYFLKRMRRWSLVSCVPWDGSRGRRWEQMELGLSRSDTNVI